MRKLLALLGGLCLFCSTLLAQSRSITGKVTDDSGNGLPNVTIQIKGTSIGTTSGTDGSYTLNIPESARVLVFSSVGMTPVEINIGNKGVINATLQSSEKEMQEVVVVGYGTQKKKDVTASIATVKGSAIADKPVQSFDQALAGRAPGVQITVPNGVLNAPPVFRIRGTNSISLSSYPLIIIDGVPAPTGDFSATSAAGNALASINPNDIESIDIAKDAAATAIYGSRAANGVVLITTKKGKNGRPRVSYNGSVGWTKAYGIPEVLNAQQYTDYKNAAAANNPTINTTNPAGAGYTKFNTATDANGNLIDTDWSDIVYRQGLSQAHNVNVSGGNDATMYYFSAGYTDQEGMLKRNDFKRANVLFNLESKLNKWLTVGGKIAYSNEKNLAASSSGSLPGEGFATAGFGRLVLVNAPSVSPFLNNGAYNITASNVVGPMNNTIAQVGFYNPQVLLDHNRSNSEANHIQSNIFIQLKPTSWLTFRTMYGIDYYLVDNEVFWTPLHGDGFAAVGNATSSYSKNKRWTWNNTLQADKTFGDHSLSVLVGSEQDRRTSVGFGLNRTQVSDPVYDVIQAGWGLNNQAGLGLGENYLLSFFGRLNYDFDKKYFISANVRQDEYSAFAAKKQLFYGLSAGWEVTKEKFWQGLGLDNVVSTLKLRASYGKVGNTAGIGDFAIYSTYGSGLYGGAATLSFNQAGNLDLQWETSTKTDVGATIGLFNERVQVEFAWYKNDISDLILNVPQSPSAGLPTSVPMNVGTMFNQGIEFSISGSPIRTRDFQWTTSFNITTNKNEVTSLAPGLNEILTSTSGLETVSRTAPGYSLGYLWVVRTGGVDPATGRRILINQQGNPIYYQFYAPAGQFNFSNANGTRYNNPDGTARTITQAADAVMYGNVIPKQYGGWDNTFKYKNFDLNVLLTYQLGFYVYYGTHAGLHDQRFWNNAVDVLGAWKKPGDITTVPKPVYGDNFSNGSALPMDYNVFKGDFVKLRNVSVGFTLPQRLLDRTKIASARLYVSGQNLAIFSKYPGPDPEVSSNGNGTTNQGIDRNTVANARTITVGLNLGF
ncbi:MAG TPA: TonB-dependent receptor [Chitinophagaceae bacterium]